MAHLLKYDSTQGRFDGDVSVDGTTLVVDGWRVPMLSRARSGEAPLGRARATPWSSSRPASSARARSSRGTSTAGATKVLLTVPPKDEIDALIVLGVNDEQLKPEHKIVCNASCTTNCLAPVAKVLHETFGIEQGLMNTIHAYTNDQAILDMPHKDLRRARAAARQHHPDHDGRRPRRRQGHARAERQARRLRRARPGRRRAAWSTSPCILAKAATVEEINAAMKAAAEGPLKGILRYTDDPIVSTRHHRRPALLDLRRGLTMSKGSFVEGLQLVRQRVGLQRALRGHARAHGRPRPADGLIHRAPR